MHDLESADTNWLPAFNMLQKIHKAPFNANNQHSLDAKEVHVLC